MLIRYATLPLFINKDPYVCTVRQKNKNNVSCLKKKEKRVRAGYMSFLF